MTDFSSIRWTFPILIIYMSVVWNINEWQVIQDVLDIYSRNPIYIEESASAQDLKWRKIMA